MVTWDKTAQNDAHTQVKAGEVSKACAPVQSTAQRPFPLCTALYYTVTFGGTVWPPHWDSMYYGTPTPKVLNICRRHKATVTKIRDTTTVHCCRFYITQNTICYYLKAGCDPLKMSIINPRATIKKKELI